MQREGKPKPKSPGTHTNPSPESADLLALERTRRKETQDLCTKPARFKSLHILIAAWVVAPITTCLLQISTAMARGPSRSQACALPEAEESSRTNLPFDNGSTPSGSKTGTAEQPTHPPDARDRATEARHDGGGWDESRSAETEATVVSLPRFLTSANWCLPVILPCEAPPCRKR